MCKPLASAFRYDPSYQWLAHLQAKAERAERVFTKRNALTLHAEHEMEVRQIEASAIRAFGRRVTAQRG